MSCEKNPAKLRSTLLRVSTELGVDIAFIFNHGCLFETDTFKITFVVNLFMSLFDK